MFKQLERFRFLESLWLAHAVACAALYLVVYVVITRVPSLVLPWLLRPVDLLLNYGDYVGLLPEWYVHYLFALTALLNGGFWYVLLRLCFRRQPPEPASGRGERESLRSIYRGTPRVVRWLVLLPVVGCGVLFFALHVELPESYEIRTRMDRVYRLQEEAFARVAPAAVSELLATAGNSRPGWEKVRPVAVQALGCLAHRRSEAYQATLFPVLVALLEDADEIVRGVAAGELGDMYERAESAIPALLRRLEVDRSDTVARAAIRALEKIGRQPERIVPVLVRRLADYLAKGGSHPSAFDRGELSAIRSFGPAARPAVPVLEQALEVFDSNYALAAAYVLAEVDPANRRLAQMLEEFSLEASDDERFRILRAIEAIPPALRSTALRKIVDEEILRLEGSRKRGALPEESFLEIKQRLLREK